MKTLIVKVRVGKGNAGTNIYHNKINAENFREIILLLFDLEKLGVPIKKAVKEFEQKSSVWDAALGF